MPRCTFSLTGASVAGSVHSVDNSLSRPSVCSTPASPSATVVLCFSFVSSPDTAPFKAADTSPAPPHPSAMGSGSVSIEVIVSPGSKSAENVSSIFTSCTSFISCTSEAVPCKSARSSSGTVPSGSISVRLFGASAGSSPATGMKLTDTFVSGSAA